MKGEKASVQSVVVSIKAESDRFGLVFVKTLVEGWSALIFRRGFPQKSSPESPGPELWLLGNLGAPQKPRLKTNGLAEFSATPPEPDPT
jgi:hypothetical protein